MVIRALSKENTLVGICTGTLMYGIWNSILTLVDDGWTEIGNWRHKQSVHSVHPPPFLYALITYTLASAVTGDLSSVLIWYLV